MDTAGEERSARATIRFYLLDHRTPLGRVVDVSLLGLNLVFLALFVAETYPLDPSTATLVWVAELGVAAVLAVEYVLRLYGAENRLAEATNPYTIADLLAILPTLLVVAVSAGVPVAETGLSLGFLRAVRVIRVLRFYRFTRDAEFFFGTVSDNSLRATKLALTVLVLLFVSAGLFYSAERVANPAVGNFGDAFYYTVVTLSTVGFGDITPVTRAGRWATVASVLAAVILIPRQAGRIVRAWTSDKVRVTCPDCGLAYHDPDASHCKACGHVVYQEYDAGE
jgi:voltage-gated potassium channel